MLIAECVYYFAVRQIGNDISPHSLSESARGPFHGSAMYTADTRGRLEAACRWILDDP